MSKNEEYKEWWEQVKEKKEEINIINKYNLKNIYNLTTLPEINQRHPFQKLFYEMETDQPISYLVYDKFFTKLAEIETTENLISYTEVKKKLSELKDIYQTIFDQIEKIHNKHTTNKIQELFEEFKSFETNKRVLTREQLGQLQTQLGQLSQSELETKSQRNQVLSDMVKESKTHEKGSSYRDLTIKFGHGPHYLSKYQVQKDYDFQSEAHRILTQEVEPIYSKTITYEDINMIFDAIDKKTIGKTLLEFFRKYTGGSKKRLGKTYLRKKSLRKKSLRIKSLKKRNSKNRNSKKKSLKKRNSKKH